MSNILNSEDFGLKIYNRFPPKYREDDEGQNFALKRYLQSLSDGGFKHSIDEINGITDLIDPDKVDAKVLSILFKQYGLEIFNGIPEEYLRHLLPRLGEAWSKKGSLSVIEYISSSLSGIKTSTRITYDENENPTIDVRLEMDYTLGNYFPEPEQFARLLRNFVPFYSDMTLLYSYLFHENQIIRCKDIEDSRFNIKDIKEESGFIGLRLVNNAPDSAVFGEAVFGNAVFGVSYDVDPHEDHITYKTEDLGVITQLSNALLNRESNTLNGNFFTNGLFEYDVVTTGSTTEIILL